MNISTTTTTKNIDFNDFEDVLDKVRDSLYQWGEELHEQGWRGSINLLIEGREEFGEGIEPSIEDSIDLERGETPIPERFEVDEQYSEGFDDSSYPPNQLYYLLLEYTGTEPYSHELVLRVTEEGTRLEMRF